MPSLLDVHRSSCIIRMLQSVPQLSYDKRRVGPGLALDLPRTGPAPAPDTSHSVRTPSALACIIPARARPCWKPWFSVRAPRRHTKQASCSGRAACTWATRISLADLVPYCRAQGARKQELTARTSYAHGTRVSSRSRTKAKLE